MKYASRYGDQRAIFYRKGDNIKVGGKFYEIVSLRDVPHLRLDLGNVAAGTLVNPTQGTKTPWNNLEPDNKDELAHVLLGVEVQRAGIQIPDGLVNPPAASIDEGQSFSPWVRYWNPQEQPQWLSPDGSVQSWIDAEISPIGDENELFPVFVIKDNEPFFRADNPHDEIAFVNIGIRATGKLYKLVELGAQPEKFAVIHGVPTKDLICPTGV